jgi:ABC-2 type transport system permease protein
MNTTKRYPKYIKLLLYVVVIVLVNLAGMTLFFRSDLTENRIYSLSPVSKKVVSTLSEPLTVKVFFTENLPAPHNNTELYLRDLLNEYAINNKRYFKPQFYNVTPETEGISDTARANREMAREYGINPVQIQMIEKDELKFKQAYMGLVLIHGDTIERIPTITSTDGLEYKLTTAIQKLNHKVSALLNLQEPVQVKLVLSPSLYQVASFMGLKELKQYPEQVKEAVEQLNDKTYGKLKFTYIDPDSDTPEARQVADHNLMELNWASDPKVNVQAGKGKIGILMQYKDQVREIPVLRVLRIPLFGDQYQLAEADKVQELVNINLDRLIHINEELGYLDGFGTLDTSGLGPMGPRDQDTLTRFSAFINENYSLKPVSIADGPVADGLKTLIIARPTEKFSDYDLYQIDQALMRGTNLAIFTDAFKETRPAGQQPFMAGQMPNYVPMDTGLEKLLEHYGVRIKKSIVLDENCYRQRMPRQQGGGDMPVYFAPIIKNENMNKELEYLKYIKGLVAVKISPLELDEKRIADQKITAHALFSSSKRAWEMRDRITLNPMFMQPPASDKEMESLPLAYLLEGSFTSYFKGKPMPEKPAEKNPEAENTESEETDSETESGTDTAADATEAQKATSAQITGTGTFKESSPPAKIFVVASSEMIKDSLLDEEGQSTNTSFVLNMVDALNGREGIAAMRSKVQRFNPVEETGAGTKVLIKTFNMVGLPILVVLFGMFVWWRRHVRRKYIQMLFQQ